VLILNLDTFAAKNVSQIRLMEAEDYAFTVVTNDSRSTSREIFEAQSFRCSRLVVLDGLWDKIATALKMLVRRRFHHVELYPAGRMALLYLVLLKALRHKIVVVERGDIDSLGYYDLPTRLSLKLAYKLADLIVYKEVYMQDLLTSFTKAPLAFIPNCVAERPVGPAGSRKLDFLWANRAVPQRRAEWVANAMRDARLSDRSLAMLGLEPGWTPEPRARPPQLSELGGPNTQIKGFVDPEPYYRSARFFCLPATIVFGNNALLEAMASGVVPVVTASPGIELLVKHGLNGIVSAFDEQAYRDAMIRAARLPEEEWQAMSCRAVETVRENYSTEAWQRKMATVYAQLHAA
jgi:glycosyltransferase involved in cell wall biosynthesis